MERTLAIREDQTIFVSIGGGMFEIRFYAFHKLMYADIIQDGEYIVAGQRVITNSWLLPEYLSDINGNFRFECNEVDGDDYVWYEDYNTKFRFCCYTPSEIAEMGG